MKRTRWAGILLLLLVVAAAAAWYFASPWYTLRQMKAAAQAGDSETFATYVDFPALREDLKAEMRAKMVAAIGKDRSGLGALGTAIGTAMIGPAVDAAVSPAGLRAAFTATAGDGKLEPEPDRANPQGAVRVPNRPVLHRRGFSQFLLASREEPGVGLVFTRHGLGWKLSGVDLPPDRPAAR